eukprot:8706070-Prorocentrum_lima.AAC.1
MPLPHHQRSIWQLAQTEPALRTAEAARARPACLPSYLPTLPACLPAFLPAWLVAWLPAWLAAWLAAIA